MLCDSRENDKLERPKIPSEVLMEGTKERQITFLLDRWNGGDPRALDRLMPLVLDELRRRALCYFSREVENHLLEPDDLIHELYQKLRARRRVSIKNSSHFFGIAAQGMRRLLLDAARARKARKRGLGVPPLPLGERDVLGHDPRSLDQIALSLALERLAALRPRQAAVVQMRFFLGLSYQEISQSLEVTDRTAKRDWTRARDWLARELCLGGG